MVQAHSIAMKYVEDYGPAQIRAIGSDQDEMVRGLWDIGAALRDSDLYWVTTKMTSVAESASSTLPDWSPQVVRPSPVGLLLFAEPPRQLRWEGAPQRAFTENAVGVSQAPLVPWSGISWRPTGDAFEIGLLCRTKSIARYLNRPWRDSALMVTGEIKVRGDSVTTSALPDWSKPVVALIGATWLLMQQKTIATRTRLATQQSLFPRPADMEERSTLNDVTIVELRKHQPANARTQPAESASGRVYRYRWDVDGHWRQQPCGPGRSLRRPTWIPPYEKGPEGAPKIRKEKVKVWRR